MTSPGYEQFRDRRPLPSVIVALLPEGSPVPDVYAVQGRLAGLPMTGSRVIEDPEAQDADWELEASFQFDRGEPPWKVRLWGGAAAHPEELHAEWRSITDAEREAAKKSTASIGVTATFTDRPLRDLHRQVRVLAAAAENPVLVLDAGACRAHGAAWLRQIAESNVPPSPENLFVIHSVFDDKNPKAGLWMHTHGLHRCGVIELEIMEAPRDDSGLLGSLMNTVAAVMIEQGVPPPGEPFPVGHRLDLSWFPWEEGIRKHPAQALGGSGDRDESHSGPSGLLFAAGRGFLGFGKKARPASSLVPILSDNPVLYVSNMETERMTLLARERFDSFAALQRAHGRKEDWVFLVKLGYTVDDAESEMDREHLWFKVEGIQGSEVDAILTNQPYRIARMNEGDRGKHALDHLSDWAILNKNGHYTPDSLHLLRQHLGGSG